MQWMLRVWSVMRLMQGVLEGDDKLMQRVFWGMGGDNSCSRG